MTRERKSSLYLLSAIQLFNEAKNLHIVDKTRIGFSAGLDAFDLTADESARLACVLPNPRKYNPAVNSRYVEKRSGLIYRVMKKRGIVVSDY